MILLSLLAVPAFAVPQTLHHQGRVLDATGAPLDGFETVHVALYDASTGGSAVWSDDPVVAFDDGYFTLELGSSIDDPLGDDVFRSDHLWLEIAVGQGAPLPRQRLVSVPYARRAGMAETLTEGAVIDVGEIRVDGQTVIDGSGTFVGAVGGETLGDLTCDDGETVAWSDTLGEWTCTLHEVRTDADVLAVIETTGVDLPSGATVDGEPISTGAHDWETLEHVPADLVDGDDFERLGPTCALGEIPAWDSGSSTWTCASDRVLTRDEVRADVTDTALDLAAGSAVDGEPISTGPHYTDAMALAVFETTPVPAPNLPADGLDEVSNGLLTAQVDTVASGTADLPIPDFDPIGVTERVTVPDGGAAELVTVQVALQSSDVSGVTVRLVAPDSSVIVLYDGADTGTSLVASFGDGRAPVSGDLGAWDDRNPAGDWTLQVIDATDDGLTDDGRVVSWSVTVRRLSADTVTLAGTLVGTEIDADAVSAAALDADAATLGDLDVTGDLSVSFGIEAATLQATSGSIGTLGTSDLTAGDVSVTGALTLGGVDVASHLVPTGAVMMFNLAGCPSGWSVLTSAAGRYPVGVTSGGTVLATVGTALSDLENRPVGKHTHAITDPGHSHRVPMDDDTAPDGGSGATASEDTDDRGVNTGTSTTGITINAAGTVDGTNAPYVQLLFCQKD